MRHGSVRWIYDFDHALHTRRKESAFAQAWFRDGTIGAALVCAIPGLQEAIHQSLVRSASTVRRSARVTVRGRLR